MGDRDELTDRQMIEINRHFIVKEMIASHILYYMPMPDFSREILRRERSEGPASANNFLIDKLLEADNSRPGWFSSFVTALEKAEFSRLVKRLRREDVKNDLNFVELIQCNLPKLRTVNPSNIMPYLLSKKVLRFR
jgi:hypothetical protein